MIEVAVRTKLSQPVGSNVDSEQREHVTIGGYNRTTGKFEAMNIDELGNIPISITESGFSIPPFDEIVLSYTGDDLTGVVYKLATVTVATLTLTYTSGKLTGIVKS